MLPPLFFSAQLPTLVAKLWRSRQGRRTILGTTPPSPSRPVAPYPAGPKSVLSFVIFRLDALGDVVLTTPLFRELKRAYPGSRCTVVVQEAYKPLLVTNPHIDEVLTLPAIKAPWLPQGPRRLSSALWFYCGRLRHRTFDFAISSRWDTDEHLAALLCLLTNAKRRVGYSEKASPAKQRSNRGFDGIFDICLPPGPVRHEVIRNLAIVEALGGTVLNADLEIPLTERDRRRAVTLLQNVPRAATLVAIGIGAASPGRRWPLERYAETLNQVGNAHHLHSVILCSHEERDDAQALAKMLNHESIVVSGAPLREVCAVLECCDLFLGNDSGCAHLAAAMDCSVIVISRHPLGGDPAHFNSPARFAPHCAHARVLQPASGIDSCKQACRVTTPHCILGVSVDAVVAAVRNMLRNARPVAAGRVPELWRGEAFPGLLLSHSPEGIRRAVEALRSGQLQPLGPA